MAINKVIKILVPVDFSINFAIGSFTPIFAIFLTDNIAGGTVETAGFATAVYWLTKSIFQLPIAKFLDKNDGETDDFYALIIGNLMGSVAILLYSVATSIMHIFLIQAFLGLSMAISVPAWYGIFTRHIDTGKTSFEWSLESVFSISIGTAASSAIGGVIAHNLGFTTLFIIAFFISFAASLSLVYLKPYLYKGNVPPSGVNPLTHHKGRRHHI